MALAMEAFIEISDSHPLVHRKLRFKRETNNQKKEDGQRVPSLGLNGHGLTWGAVGRRRGPTPRAAMQSSAAAEAPSRKAGARAKCWLGYGIHHHEKNKYQY